MSEPMTDQEALRLAAEKAVAEAEAAVAKAKAEAEAAAKAEAAKQQEGDCEHKFGFAKIAKTAFWALTTMAMFAMFTAATFAWFSSNSIVTTDKVSGRTGTDQVELQISSNGGADFGKEAPLVQINQSSSELLMPVSTADLRTFVTSPGMVDGKATYFEKIAGERYYYHGRIYLRANSVGHAENARLALYLDSSQAAGGSLVTDTKGYIANAARLGLIFDNGNAQIMRLSENSNPSGQQTMNAVLNGTTVQAGQVINGSTDPMTIATDPSVPIAYHMVGDDGLAGNASATPLLYMNLNQIYTVDVYFYLEGCDPDCSEVARLDSLNLHLAFYGILVEGAN
ncbi:MAG: hypothetical protein II743_00390 [Lachnospiraceae bacterium]|nr:hypothetical protein [Lachnospiraceae bacterium]